MKKALFVSLTLSVCLLLGGCAPPDEPPTDSFPPSENPSGPTVTENSVVLSVSNAFNTATARFTARYTAEGIVLDADVADSDVYADVYYSAGYDDNVEYLINLASSVSEGWDTQYTYHFLITADGDTFLQRAVTANEFGASYSFDLLCSFGENFSYEAELTPEGYRTSVFLSYSLLNTTYEEGYENLCVCPAMRNTHDYADSVWTPYRGGGCDWNAASTFLRTDAGGYVISAGKEAEVLFIGDEQLNPSRWHTFYDDTATFGAVNLAVQGGTASHWRENLSAVTEYTPKNIVLFFTQSDEDAARNTILLMEDLHTLLPETFVYYTSCPSFGVLGNVSECNRAVSEFCEITDYAEYIPFAEELSQKGIMYVSAEGNGLSQMGYNLWMRSVRGALGLVGGKSDIFGDGMLFAAGASFTDENGVTHLDGTHDQYAYFKGGGDEFFAETSFEAIEVYGGDEYPKFGLILSVKDSTLFFYIDGSSALSAKRVGYVRYDDNCIWNWGGSVEQSREIAYTNGQTCKLSLLKYGGYLFLFVNGEVAFTLSDPFADQSADVGVLAFNTHVALSEALFTQNDLISRLPNV